jgi:opacity protein-like surface antigen
VITRIIVFGIALVAMIGTAAQAQEDFSRPGAYMGIGLALGVEAWDGAPGNMGTPLGVDVLLGYRATPNMAVEAEIEYLNGFEPDGEPVDVDALTATANLKAYLPMDRFQPFALVGMGMTTYWFNSFSESAFSMRFGGGADYYLTENISMGVKIDYVLTTGDLEELIGGDYVGFAFGAQYHF